ncbi:MAG: DNA polymerase I [Alphaproteobacteria bacterium]|nr:DNA polymerase I [Alphaproteobacteria bacterium]
MSQPAAPATTPLYLVDGSGYIFRAYHALPPLTRKKDGMPTGAVYGFCNMLSKLLADIEAQGGAGHLAVLFDAGRKTFRSDIYDGYKAQRPPPPEDLVPQFKLIRDAVRAFNLPCIEKEGFEADDIIATFTRLARAHGTDVVIVSSDKDLMQLIRPGVRMHDPLKDRPIGEEQVREKFGVAPAMLTDLLALTGDTSDNVPGIPGVGPKTAAELLNAYGNLDTLLERAGEIKQPKRREAVMTNAEKARLSRRLVALDDHVPVPQSIEDLAVRRPDPRVLLPFLEELEFTNLVTRLRARYGTDAAAEKTVKAPTPIVVELPAIAVREPGPLAGPAVRLTPPKRYATLTTLESLAALADEARAAGILGLHIEIDPPDENAGEIVGIALSAQPGIAWYAPLAVARSQSSLAIEGPDEEHAFRLDAALEILKPLFEDPSVLKVLHDAKRAMKVLARHGVDVTPIEDTLLLSFVLGGGRDEHGHADICERELGARPPPRKEIVGSGKNEITFQEVPLERATAYAGGLADTVLQSRECLRRRLYGEKLVSVYETIERPLVPVLLAMEQAGVRIDPEALVALSEDFGARMVTLETEIHAIAGRSFNLGSPKQLGEILFDEMKLEGGRKTKTGAWSTDAEVLEQLAADGHALPEKILDWRQVSKLKSTYTDTLGGQMNRVTGRVHTSYLMAGAATGRLASTEPNLQNIPIRTEEGRRIRRAFVAPRGHKLVSADYSQIELRLLAHVAKIDALKEAFHNGVDIHALTASQVFGIPIDKLDRDTRNRAKAINFGIIYGISAFGLARQLGIARGDAGNYIAAYFARYPGIRDYMDKAKEFAKRNGYVVTLFGRRVHMPGIHDRNHSMRSFSERASINAPPQGTAADILKRAMVRMHRALQESRLKSRMLLSVHDELLFEAPNGEVEALKALAKKTMEGAAHLDVPLTVETGAGDNWDEAH